MTTANLTKVIVPCRLSYAHLWEPDSINGSEPKYSVSCIIDKVIWVCNGRKRKGKDFCDGTRVPDTIIKGWGEIKKDIYIQRKDDKNGKKRYSYTSKKPKGADRA